MVRSNILIKMLVRTSSVKSDILTRLLMVIIYQGSTLYDAIYPPSYMPLISIFRPISDNLGVSCLDPARSFGLRLELSSLHVSVSDMYDSIGVSADRLSLIQFHIISFIGSFLFNIANADSLDLTANHKTLAIGYPPSAQWPMALNFNFNFPILVDCRIKSTGAS